MLLFLLNIHLGKRPRNPLLIKNPDTHEIVKVEKPPATDNGSSNTTTAADDTRQKESVTDSIASDSKSTDETNKSQIQAEFRHSIARLLHPDSQADKVYKKVRSHCTFRKGNDSSRTKLLIMND